MTIDISRGRCLGYRNSRDCATHGRLAPLPARCTLYYGKTFNDLLTDTNDSRKETVFIRNDIISRVFTELSVGKSMRYDVAVNVHQMKIHC